MVVCESMPDVNARYHQGDIVILKSIDDLRREYSVSVYSDGIKLPNKRCIPTAMYKYFGHAQKIERVFVQTDETIYRLFNCGNWFFDELMFVPPVNDDWEDNFDIEINVLF